MENHIFRIGCCTDSDVHGALKWSWKNLIFRIFLLLTHALAIKCQCCAQFRCYGSKITTFFSLAPLTSLVTHMRTCPAATLWFTINIYYKVGEKKHENRSISTLAMPHKVKGQHHLKFWKKCTDSHTNVYKYNICT